MEECQQIFVMSKFWLATEDTLTIPFMEGYFEDQVQPDYVHDPKKDIGKSSTVRLEKWFQ